MKITNCMLENCIFKIGRGIYELQECSITIKKKILTNETHNIHDSGKERHISSEFDIKKIFDFKKNGKSDLPVIGFCPQQLRSKLASIVLQKIKAWNFFAKNTFMIYSYIIYKSIHILFMSLNIKNRYRNILIPKKIFNIKLKLLNRYHQIVRYFLHLCYPLS